MQRRRQQSQPTGPGAAILTDVDDESIEDGWYADIVPELPRLTTERFGELPAPRTVPEYLEVCAAVAAKLEAVVAWRGQADIGWGIHSSAARRVMFQEWIPPGIDRVAKILANVGLDEHETYKAVSAQARRDEHPWAVAPELLAYELSLLNESRAAGHDWVDGRRLGDVELFALLQHYGAATPLLDVSRNAIMGLWFASETHMDITGVVMVVGDAGVARATASVTRADWPKARRELPNGKVVLWIPRRISPRMAAQEAAFLISRFRDPPWGSLDIRGTLRWKSDEPASDEPTAAFIAVSPELKKAVYSASRVGVLAYSGVTVYPDLPGFAQYNGAGRDILFRGV